MKIKPCVPDSLPLRSINWESFIDLVGKAHEVTSKFDEIIKSVKNPSFVFSNLIVDETLSSLHSQKVSVSRERLLYAQTLGKENENLQKLINYKKALLESSKQIKSSSITPAMIRKIHGRVKENSNENLTEIGKFRKRQNWIGPEGRGMKEAYFLPPDVKIMDRYMGNLMEYLNYKEKDPLVQLAIFFAQFLIIHPFMDGNGRVARALIPLFLYKKKVTSCPMFYLSAYFKRHRLKYFEKLYSISTHKDWEGWICFFLKGMIEEGERHVQKSKIILSLYHEFLDIAGKEERAFVDSLFHSPIFSKDKWNKQIQKLKILRTLEKEKLIVPYKGTMLAVKKLLTSIQ